MRSREHIHQPHTVGEQLADTIAATMGSWRFIIIQTIFVMAWIGVNLAGIVLRWDPYPFILLNLLFSTQAAYAAPIIMMSQNRQAAKDHVRDDLEAEEVGELFSINKQQLVILDQQTEILQLLRGSQQTAEKAEVQVLLTGVPTYPKVRSGTP